MSDFITFYIGHFYSVESGWVNSGNEVTIKKDDIEAIYVTRTPYSAMPFKYSIIMKKDNRSYVSVDSRLNEQKNFFRVV